MLRQVVRGFSTLKPGQYIINFLQGSTNLGFIGGAAIGSFNPVWKAVGNLSVKETGTGMQEWTVNIVPKSHKDLRIGMVGPSEFSVNVEDHKGGDKVTRIKVVKGATKFSGLELDVSGTAISQLNIQLNAKSQEKSTTLSGSVDPSEIVELPSIARTIAALFGSPVKVHMEVTKQEEVQSSKPSPK